MRRSGKIEVDCMMTHVFLQLRDVEDGMNHDYGR